MDSLDKIARFDGFQKIIECGEFDGTNTIFFMSSGKKSHGNKNNYSYKKSLKIKP